MSPLPAKRTRAGCGAQCLFYSVLRIVFWDVGLDGLGAGDIGVAATLPRALGDSCGHGPSISDAVVRAGRSIAWPFREMFPLLPGNISGRGLAILCLLT